MKAVRLVCVALLAGTAGCSTPSGPALDAAPTTTPPPASSAPASPAAAPAPGPVTSFAGALATAFRANPALGAARAEARAANELVPQAEARLRPQINASVTGAANYTVQNGDDGAATAGVTLSQIVYDGDQGRNAVAGAQADTIAAEARLRQSEQAVLLDAGTAYFDVVRDQAVLALNDSSIAFLNGELADLNQRVAAGDATRTDLLLLQSGIATARASRSLAEGDLAESRATFVQLVGAEAGALSGGAGLDALLPRSLAEARAAAAAQHPAILAAGQAAIAASYALRVAEGVRRPQVSIEANVQQRFEIGATDTSAQILGRITIPIYDGGLAAARQREAEAILAQRQFEAADTTGQVEAAVVSAWGRLEASRTRAAATEDAVDAAALALDTVRREEDAGLRSTLDVVDAERLLIQARIARAQAEHDTSIAALMLLAALGQLTPERLGLAVD